MNRQIINDPKTGEKICRCFKRCGGCQLQESYAEQLTRKQEKAERMLSKFAKVRPIIAMDSPYYYRCKVQNVYGKGRGGELISGIFQSTGQKMVAVDDCMLEDRRAAPIVQTLKKLMHDLKIQPYDLRTGSGLLRHTLIRVSALQKAHPELTTIVQNICPDGLPLTLGERSITLAGKGYIEDILCGCRFRISPASFYQVNPVQTEKLYTYAVEAAGIRAGVSVIDAYCGTGTIGMICAKQGADVIGIELNRFACRDAAENAKRNQLENIRFCNEDAGKFLQRMAKEGERCDVLLMDPPRAGASPAFLRAAAEMKPERIVYVSCKIETLERDLKQLTQSGYRVTDIQPVDMFPHTTGIETVCVLEKKSPAQRPGKTQRK